MNSGNASTARSNKSCPAASAVTQMSALSSPITATITSTQQPHSTTLSILEGLVKRHEFASTIVDEALDQFRASDRIARICTRYWSTPSRRCQLQQQYQPAQIKNPPSNAVVSSTTQSATSSHPQCTQKRRGKRRKVGHSATTATTAPSSSEETHTTDVNTRTSAATLLVSATTSTATAVPTNTPIATSIKWEHWLWRAMRSTSWSELQLASRLALLHVVMPTKKSTPSTAPTGSSIHHNSDNSLSPPVNPYHNRMWDLRDVLVYLLQRYVIMEPARSFKSLDPYPPSTWSSRQLNSSRRQRQDVSWVWITMLKHLIISPSPADDRGVGLLAFCASAGLHWICQAILCLALQLEQHAAAATSSNSIGSTLLSWSGIAAVSDQRRNIVHRLVLFVDLCYRMVLHGSLVVPHKKVEDVAAVATTSKNATTTTAAAATSSDRQHKNTSKESKETGRASIAAEMDATNNTIATAITTTNTTTNSTTGNASISSKSQHRRIGVSNNKEETCVVGNTTTSAPSLASATAAVSELKQKRVLALQKVHRLLWKASIIAPSSNAFCSHFLEFKNLSPLACLLCTYHLLTGDPCIGAICKASPHWTYCISILGQLVDPNASVKVAVATLRNVASPPSSSTMTNQASLPSNSNVTAMRDESAKTTTTAAAAASVMATSNTAANTAATSAGFPVSFFAPSAFRDVVSDSTGIVATAEASKLATDENGGGSTDFKQEHGVNHRDDDDDEDQDVIMVDAEHQVDLEDEDDDDDGGDDDVDADDDDGSRVGAATGEPVRLSAMAADDDEVGGSRDEDDDDDDNVVMMEHVHDDDDDDEKDDDDDDDHDGVLRVEVGGSSVHPNYDDDTCDDDDEDDSDDNFFDGDESDDGGCGHDDQDFVIQDDDMARQLEEGFIDLNDGEAMEIDLDEVDTSASSSALAAAVVTAASAFASSHASNSSGIDPAISLTSKAAVDNNATTNQERKHALIRAGMQILSQHVQTLHSSTSAPHAKPGFEAAHPQGAMGRSHDLKSTKQQLILTLPAEFSLLTAMLHVVKPPKKPLNLRIFLRRAPTQEEFFRGSLSKNPILLSALGASTSTINRASSNSGSHEPTVRDLRQHIANDLHMSDSAELLELLVANKILDNNLKLRVVHQVLWRNHLTENTSATLSSISSFLSGSGISAVFGSSLERAGSSGGGRNVAADTPSSALPPMMVTYRLAGVDGEATEDTVNELLDPEAPLMTASPAEVETLLEREYGITRVITEGRGVHMLLRSVENHVLDTLRRIRRDDVICSPNKNPKNPSRSKFRQCQPYAGLTLLRCCAKLSGNRKKLLQARAPTMLLRLLLDVLNALDEQTSGGESEQHERIGSCPTAEVLQELIEILSSDISAVPPPTAEKLLALDGYESDSHQDEATLPLLLSSLESIYLSPGLRKIIAKLLPFLTYGQVSLSQELASKFKSHVFIDSLCEFETADKVSVKSSMLMDTFVQSSIDLPTNEVCNTLRSELINCGYVEMILGFVLKEIPSLPPPWSPPLWGKDESPEKSSVRRKRSVGRREQLEEAWREYFARPGLRTAFSMLVGLCRNHIPTQAYVARFNQDGKSVSLLQACHWMETTSDNISSRIPTNGLGLLAETLLDEIKAGNDEVTVDVDAIRRKTRERKKEIAKERRSKTLAAMNSFGNMSGDGNDPQECANSRAALSVRDTAASFLAPVLTFLTGSGVAADSTARNQSSQSKRSKKLKGTTDRNSPTKPSWMLEMESMEDEKGLTCAVCQEGRTLQPSELLGLYAYVKKVSIPSNLCGARNLVDGTALLTSLPLTLPDSLMGTHAAVEWFQIGKATADDLRDDSSSSSSSSQSALKRMVYYTTTVSAGNSIHFSCHAKARQADRSHPKAPKSEWEGASLRNSRVSCNVILPLVSSRSSKVPLVAVDSALTDYQTAISNLIGARPKSMLWTVLHDIRFLLLRMSHAEALNADCGGGSFASNSQLLFYQMLMADMFEKDAQVDAPETAQHARNLSAGYLAACAICRAEDLDNGEFMTSSLLRHIADSAIMAGITCILFHNTRDDYSDAKEPDDITAPHPKRRWLIGRDDFLAGLMNCAGRRHALGIEDSGCLGSRNRSGRSTTFADWELLSYDENTDIPSSVTNRKKAGHHSGKKRSHMAAIDDFGPVLRPMITLFAILDTISNEFVLNIMDDEHIAASSNRLVEVIESCQRSMNCWRLPKLLVIMKPSWRICKRVWCLPENKDGIVVRFCNTCVG